MYGHEGDPYFLQLVAKSWSCEATFGEGLGQQVELGNFTSFIKPGAVHWSRVCTTNSQALNTFVSKFSKSDLQYCFVYQRNLLPSQLQRYNGTKDCRHNWRNRYVSADLKYLLNPHATIGTIGGAVARSLSQNPDFQVRVLTRDPFSLKALALMPYGIEVGKYPSTVFQRKSLPDP